MLSTFRDTYLANWLKIVPSLFTRGVSFPMINLL